MAIGSIASGRLEPTTVGEMRVSPAGGWTGNQRIPFGFNPASPLNVATAPTTATGSIASGMLASAFNAPPPQQRSMLLGSAEQFSRLPEQPARPSDLFSTAVPAFPSQLAQPMGQAPTDLRSTPAVAPTTDAITSFGNPMASRTERINSPYGTASTTLTPEQQTQRFQARQQAEQMGTIPRTPEQQQALIDNIRKNAPALNQQRTDWVQNTIQQRRENPATAYVAESGGLTGPSSFRVGVPTNRFGEPIQSFANIYQQRNERMGRGSVASVPTPSATGSVDSGFMPSAFDGGPQPSRPISMPVRNSSPTPMPVVDSSGQRMGVTSDFGGFGSPIRMGLGGMGFGGMEAFTRGQPTPITQTPYGTLNLPNTQDLLSRRRPIQTTLFT